MTETPSQFRSVGAAADLDEGSVNPYYLEDLKHRVSVARVGDRFYAFDDLCTCTEERCPLSAGLLSGTTIMCQCHGSQFDLASGSVLRGPATEQLRTYEARVQDGEIRVWV